MSQRVVICGIFFLSMVLGCFSWADEPGPAKRMEGEDFFTERPSGTCDELAREFQQSNEYDQLSQLTPVEKIGLWTGFKKRLDLSPSDCGTRDSMKLEADGKIRYWQDKLAGKKEEMKFVDPVEILPRKVEADGSLTLYNNGIAVDTESGLEWIAGPDIPTNWLLAKHWAKNLTLEGGGWHLPNRQELKTIVRKREHERRQVTRLLLTTGWWLWSSEPYDSVRVWVLNLENGQDFWVPFNEKSVARAFAVRKKAIRRY